MPMKPVAELLPAVRSQPATAFAARFGQQDLIVAEPYEKGRDYRGQPPLHTASVFDLMTRAPGAPIPVGRDARAVVQLDHAAVSRLHLVIAFANQGWKVMDRSSNGTWLDEERMPQQQAVPLAYGVCVRLGRAMVVRVFTPEQFWELARRSAADQAPPAPIAAPPPPPPADPRASTWRFAPVQDSLLQPDPGDSEELPPLPRNATTQKFARPSAYAPPPSTAPPPPKGPDAIDFEFDLDFNDGKGGFA